MLRILWKVKEYAVHFNGALFVEIPAILIIGSGENRFSSSSISENVCRFDKCVCHAYNQNKGAHNGYQSSFKAAFSLACKCLIHSFNTVLLINSCR